MTSLTIELPDEKKAALAAKAQARGLSVEQYARQVLEHDLVTAWLENSWETSREAGLDQLSIEEIRAEISAVRKARRESRLQQAANRVTTAPELPVLHLGKMTPLHRREIDSDGC
jgi:plasmid stability protein